MLEDIKVSLINKVMECVPVFQSQFLCLCIPRNLFLDSSGPVVGLGHNIKLGSQCTVTNLEEPYLNTKEIVVVICDGV